jgi:SAM-dependent methyltransferase
MLAESISVTLDTVADPAFRARAFHEYKIVTRYLGRVADNTRILDFGCGEGIAAASFALRHPSAKVFGTDIQTVNPERLRAKLEKLVAAPLPANLDLRLIPPSSLPDDIHDLDIIYSWSVFEHVRADLIVPILKMLRERLRPSGKFFLQIDPLYFSPRGAHLYGAIPEPWCHLLHQTDVLHEKLLASSLPDASKSRLWEQYRTLNRATADDITDACVEAGFTVAKRETLKSDLESPAPLLRAYSREALTTSELRLLLAH